MLLQPCWENRAQAADVACRAESQPRGPDNVSDTLSNDCKQLVPLLRIMARQR